jgi:pimeloyl-ACP methyl ester carboxylesterase
MVKTNGTRLNIRVGGRGPAVVMLHGFGDTAMADDLRFVATNVPVGIVPHSGHWIMEESPPATIKFVTDFLANEQRLAVGTAGRRADAPGGLP